MVYLAGLDQSFTISQARPYAKDQASTGMFAQALPESLASRFSDESFWPVIPVH